MDLSVLGAGQGIFHFPLTVVLCDLIASWLVLIEVVLPIKGTLFLDGTI